MAPRNCRTPEHNYAKNDSLTSVEIAHCYALKYAAKEEHVSCKISAGFNECTGECFPGTAQTGINKADSCMSKSPSIGETGACKRPADKDESDDHLSVPSKRQKCADSDMALRSDEDHVSSNNLTTITYPHNFYAQISDADVPMRAFKCEWCNITFQHNRSHIWFIMMMISRLTN